MPSSFVQKKCKVKHIYTTICICISANEKKKNESYEEKYNRSGVFLLKKNLIQKLTYLKYLPNLKRCV